MSKRPMPMHGSRMPGGAGMPVRKLDKRTLKRLLSYMKNYKVTLVLVTVCILLSSVAGAAASMFLQSLIDDYITPHDRSGLARLLGLHTRADNHGCCLPHRHALNAHL